MRSALLVCLLGGLLARPTLASAAPRVLHAKAFDLESGALLYTMRFDEQLEGGRLVHSRLECRDLRGKVIYTEEARYDHDGIAPTVQIHNLLTGAEERAERVHGGSVVRYRADRDAELEELTLQVPPPVVHTGGVDALVAQKWDALAKGRDVRLSMVAPSRKAWYRFRLVGEGMTEKRKRPVLAVRLEAENAVLRLFAGELRMFFDPASRQLVEYEGRGSVTDADGDAHVVHLVFER